jgi:DNA repair protein RadD
MTLYENIETKSRVYTLRDYQQEASDAAIRFFNDPRKKSGIIILPTGAGKSLVIADVVNKLKGNTIVLSHSKEILEQNYEKLLSYDQFADISIFSASFNSKEISKVTYATIGSVNNNRHLFKHFDYIIIDEVHQTNAKQGMYKKFFEVLGNKKYLGLTATPYRSFTNSFGTELRFTTRTRPRLFEEVLYYSQISDLKKQGYLADMEYYSVSDNFDTNRLQVNSTRMDYTDDSVHKYYNEIHFEKQIADVVNRLLKAGRKNVLVFTKFINESEAVKEILGDKARVVSAYTDKKERSETLKLFKSGKLKVVLNCSALGIGFDYPALDTVLMAQPTRSLIRWYQFVGRAFRPHPSKKSAWIVDMCGTYERFGRVERLRLANDGGNKWYYHIGGKRLTNVYLD